MPPVSSVLPAAAAPLRVACFCARWCRLCGDYQAVFDAAVATLGDAALGTWIDIEDDADLLGPVDVIDFPTLLIARDGEPCFFGPITPQPGTLARLLRSAQDGSLARLDEPEVLELYRRVAARPGDNGATA